MSLSSSFDHKGYCHYQNHSELIDPVNICHVLVSPRIRARRTFELMFEGLPEQPSHEFTEDVREWDYGDYEGLKPAEILAIDPEWKIWYKG